MAAGPPLPPKRDVALALLKGDSGPTVFVHLDPRRKGVIVPKNFADQHQLILQLGMNMAVPIPDLDIGHEGIGCTLSFSQRPFWCFLPWHAVYALVGDDSRGMVWPDDVPPEVAGQRQKPKLSVVGGKGGKAADGGTKESREPEEDQPRRPRGRLAAATAAAMQLPPDDGDEPEPPRRGAHLSVVPAGDDAPGDDAPSDDAPGDDAPASETPASETPASAKPALTAVPTPDTAPDDDEPPPDGDTPGSGGLPSYLRVVK